METESHIFSKRVVVQFNRIGDTNIKYIQEGITLAWIGTPYLVKAYQFTDKHEMEVAKAYILERGCENLEEIEVPIERIST